MEASLDVSYGCCTPMPTLVSDSRLSEKHTVDLSDHLRWRFHTRVRTPNWLVPGVRSGQATRAMADVTGRTALHLERLGYGNIFCREYSEFGASHLRKVLYSELQ
jgi:hypothetical protein